MIEQVWNEGRTDLVEEFFTKDYAAHAVGQPTQAGYGFVQQAVTSSRIVYPDFRLSIEDQLAEGDSVAARWTMSGTQEGEFYGIPPTRKQVSQSGATFYRLENGRIAETWFLSDTMGLMQQLGLMPAPQTE